MDVWIVFGVVLATSSSAAQYANFTPFGIEYSADKLLQLLFNNVGHSVTFLFTHEMDVPIWRDVRFFCTNRDKENTKQVLLGDVNQSYIDVSKPTTFLVHGWLDNANRTWMLEAAREHKKYRDMNICLVDWSRLSNYVYPMSVTFTRRVGAYLAKFIEWLENDLNADIDNITVVGHSLGGQIAGFCGQNLRGRLGHIIALDPAGPDFTTDRKANERLDKTDAKFVQVMHTAGMTLGVFPPCGHVDFYPNNGIAPQTGCPWEPTDPPDLLVCSHLRAYRYFISSLNPANQFYGRPCKDLTHWLIPLMCSNNGPLNIFGYEVKKNHRGSFFLTTNAYAPYSKGRMV